MDVQASNWVHLAVKIALDWRFLAVLGVTIARLRRKP
jgi:hypothetical protein